MSNCNHCGNKISYGNHSHCVKCGFLCEKCISSGINTHIKNHDTSVAYIPFNYILPESGKFDVMGSFYPDHMKTYMDTGCEVQCDYCYSVISPFSSFYHRGEVDKCNKCFKLGMYKEGFESYSGFVDYKPTQHKSDDIVVTNFKFENKPNMERLAKFYLGMFSGDKNLVISLDGINNVFVMISKLLNNVAAKKLLEITDNTNICKDNNMAYFNRKEFDSSYKSQNVIEMARFANITYEMNAVEKWLNEKMPGIKLDSDIKIGLFNYSKFIVEWANKFSNTRETTFTDSDGKKEGMLGMSNTSSYQYYIDKTFTSVILKTKSDNKIVMFIKPTNGSIMNMKKELFSDLTQVLTNIVCRSTEDRIILMIPKIEFTSELDILQKIKLSTIQLLLQLIQSNNSQRCQ